MRRIAVSLFALALLGVSWPAGATVVVAVSVDEMARSCATAVRGTVVARHAAWDDQHRRIYTYTDIQVLETLAGVAVPGTRVTVRSLGGVVGEVGMNVSGTPRFTEGEEVVVFLQPDRLQESRFVVLGMSQGKFHVDRQGELPMVLRDTAGLAFASPAGPGPMTVGERKTESRLTLDGLRDRVRAVRPTAEAPSPSRGLVAPSVPAGPATAVPPVSSPVAPVPPQAPTTPDVPADPN